MKKIFNRLMSYRVTVFLQGCVGLSLIILMTKILVNWIAGDALLSDFGRYYFVAMPVVVAVGAVFLTGFYLRKLKKAGVDISCMKASTLIYGGAEEMRTSLAFDEVLEVIKNEFQWRVKRISKNRIAIHNGTVWGNKTVLEFISRDGGGTRVCIACRRIFPLVDDGEGLITRNTLHRLLKVSDIDRKEVPVQATTVVGVKSGTVPNSVAVFLRYFLRVWVLWLPLILLIKFISDYGWESEVVFRSIVSGSVFAVVVGLVAVGLSRSRLKNRECGNE